MFGCRPVSGDINLLKYFQQQRLEHTRLLRKEITRLEKLEKVYLTAIKKVCAASHYHCRYWSLVGKCHLLWISLILPFNLNKHNKVAGF